MSTIARFNIRERGKDTTPVGTRRASYDRNSRHDLCDLETKPTAGASGGQSLLVRTRGCCTITRIVYARAPHRNLTRRARGSNREETTNVAGEDTASEKSEHYAGLGSLQDCRLPSRPPPLCLPPVFSQCNQIICV